MAFTDELFENGLVQKCLKVLRELEPLKETERFRGTSAGDSRLTQEVTDLVIEQRCVCVCVYVCTLCTVSLLQYVC